MKNTDPDYDDDSVFVTISVTNRTDKVISGIKVVVTAADVFGDNLDRYGPKSEKDLAPGETIRLSGHYRSSRFLRANPEKVTVSAQATQIVFKDGSQLKNPRYQ
ncbi:hypothetical protein ERD78_07145 [Allopusillimonas soli]|uniref:Uncharacterized protein n=1 Tax=Allopusillimonas soli TaxID=659016 RepID=A0A853FAK9_9BURK|nr:hypothetical protein [Allopusillimonas soli]NYT36642.1 hypothetical protein [Allopusillimonas soli]TEA75127.1 hypothetical protein ERD78_07145 [Allopusillimonas soli]